MPFRTRAKAHDYVPDVTVLLFWTALVFRKILLLICLDTSSSLILFFVKHFLAITTIIAVVAAPAFAHHSFARAYFENKSISISGEIVAFEFRSPHAWVQIMAPDENGQLQKYSAEWFNPSRLSKMNVTKDTLKPGDHVVISGSPSRIVNEYKLHLKRIERPADGWKCC